MSVYMQGTTLRSVRHALGSSFGSLALGSAILTAVQIARQIVEVRDPVTMSTFMSSTAGIPQLHCR